jgi:hypothetical protein
MTAEGNCTGGAMHHGQRGTGGTPRWLRISNTAVHQGDRETDHVATLRALAAQHAAGEALHPDPRPLDRPPSPIQAAHVAHQDTLHDAGWHGS